MEKSIQERVLQDLQPMINTGLLHTYEWWTSAKAVETETWVGLTEFGRITAEALFTYRARKMLRDQKDED